MPDRNDVVDLTLCDREPIHIPGAVQPWGCLLAMDERSLAVVQAAGACETVFGAPAEALPGRAFADLVPQAVAAELARLVRADLPSVRMPLPLDFVLGERSFAGAVHRSGGRVVLEVTPADGAFALDTLGEVQRSLAALGGTGTVTAFLAVLAREVRRITGYGRVMVYRFQEDDSGVVIAEDRRPDLEEYLGLHYPASDIPVQARALYLRNWIRFIPDALYRPAPIVPALDPETGAPLDLTDCMIRSVSPVHLEYLANMGVAASLSLSLVVQGRLWGLVACHDDRPHTLPRSVLRNCELIAQIASLQLAERLGRTESQDQLRSRTLLSALVNRVGGDNDVGAGLRAVVPDLIGLVPSEGLAVIWDGSVTLFGRTPPGEVVERFVAWLNATQAEGVYATDRMAEVMPEAADHTERAAGFLSVSISRSPRDYILWFRPEIEQTVTWAGAPTKVVTIGDDGVRLHPRTSFKAWRETVRGRSRPWTAQELDLLKAFRLAMLEVVLKRVDEVAREREKARAHQDLLMAELDHRVKNTLATIQALARQSSRGATDLEEYVRQFEMRLRSMALTHSLLTKNRWLGADLRQLLKEELAAYGDESSGRYRLDGANLALRPKATISLGLAVHELATNAAKYGAFSLPDGHVSVRWSIDGGPAEPMLTITWTETGGPTVGERPKRRGFGMTLIERTLALDVSGRAELRFEPKGLVCIVQIPASEVIDPEPAAVATGHGHAAPQERIRDTRVLLVEDNALVALDAQIGLEDAGVVVVGPVARLAAAVSLAETAEVDAAFLDVDLHGQPVWEAADVLAGRGVPFAFTTGFEASVVVPDRFRSVPVVSKPYRASELAGMLIRLVGTGGGPAQGG
ncbi:HWE histidine kinase domain-containing protein [Chthonobacter rhizosphaerae]|uniref:HWE histidine kinase domain-containing protein n=1 Tax=Chthonobacter rhizosphaerae TaxID=2735553 RepID=UPI0015EF06A8